MTIVQSKLTIVFDNPFWVGIFERVVGDQYEVAKVTFGAEPRADEIYQLVLTNFDKVCFRSGETVADVTTKNLTPNTTA